MYFTIQRPDLGNALAETEKDIERAVTSGMRDAADGLKQDLREDVIAAGLGERLSRQFLVKEFGGERPSRNSARVPRPQPRAWPAQSPQDRQDADKSCQRHPVHSDPPSRPEKAARCRERCQAASRARALVDRGVLSACLIRV